MKTIEEMKALLSSAIGTQFELRLMSNKLKNCLEKYPELKGILIRNPETEIVNGVEIEKLPDYTLETFYERMDDFVNMLTITLEEMRDLLIKEASNKLTLF